MLPPYGVRPTQSLRPAPCPLFPLPQPCLWTARFSLSPATVPFNGLRRHRRAASGCRATGWKAAHFAARAQTLPHQPVCAAACGLISPPPLLRLTQKATTLVWSRGLQWITRQAILWARGSVGWDASPPGTRTMRLWKAGWSALQARSSCLPPSLFSTSPYLPPLFLSAGGQASFAFWLLWDHSGGCLGLSSPLAAFSLKFSVAYKIPGFFGHLSLSLSQPSPGSPSLSLKFLRLLLPWNSNNLRDEGSFSMCLPDSPNFRGLCQRRVLEISNARLSFSLKT